MRREAIGNERIEDGRHDEVRYTTTGIAEACRQRICSSNDIIIEDYIWSAIFDMLIVIWPSFLNAVEAM